MALFNYQQITQRLLADTLQVRFNLFDLRDWINIARSQIATEGEAIRQLGTLSTANGTPNYNFSSIVLTGTGLNGVAAVRQIATPTAILTPREWEWYFTYQLANGDPTGTPTFFSQLAPGSAGSLYLGPTPNAIIALNLDVVALPAALNLDSDTEALPYPWTDAVPYFAAYMALLTAKDFDAADRMFMLFERFMLRARAQVTPTVLPRQYPGGQSAQNAGTHTGIVTPATPVGGGGAARGG